MKMKSIAALLMAVIMLFGSMSVGFTANAGQTADEKKELGIEIATESMVLLKNDNNTLPLKEDDKIAVFGRTQVDTINGGLGSGYVYCPYVVSVLGGIENYGINVDEELASIYKTWCEENPPAGEGNIWGSGLRYNPEMPLTAEQAAGAKERGANKAVVVLGRIPGENTDLGLGKGDYYLTDLEVQMLQNVAASFEDIILVLNVGYIIDLSCIEEYGIDSVVYMSLAGQDGGNALAEILTGQAVPSGKLNDTIAYEYSDYPTSEIFGGSNTQDYTEDIYVGYRYFETFDPDYTTVRFPFGFGLSYTSFEIDNVQVAFDDTNVNVTARVTNTGDTYSGKEVVQVYYAAPSMNDAENPSVLGNPGKELGAFVKTDELAPGESQTVELSFPIADMASFDDTGITGHENAWVLEKGNYDIFVGNSIKNAGERGTAGVYTQSETVVTEQAIADLPTQLSSRLLENGEYEELEVENPGGIEIPADGFAVPAEGVTKIEAEAFSSITSVAQVEEWVNGDEQGKSLGWMREGEEATYTLNTEKAGTYRLKFRYANAYGDKKLSEMMNITLDGGTSMAGLELDFPNTCTAPQYFGFEDSGEVLITLPKGKMQFAISSNDNEFINIDYFTLEYVPGEEKVTDISASGVSKLEMEDFYDSSDVVRSESFADDGSGNPGECLAWMHTAGNYASYKLNVEEAGRYKVTFRYASYHNPITLADMARIWIGNVEALGLEVTFNTTSTADNMYHNFVMSDSVELQLQGGMVEFKVESKTVSFVNLDYITFEKIDDTKQALRRSAFVPAAVNDKTYMLEDVYNGVVTMDEFLSQLTIEELANLTQGTGGKIPEINTNCIGGLSKYGIPAGQTADGPGGFRVPASMEATSWPSGNLLAMSWDEDLAYRYGVAIGLEATDFGIDFWLAPGANIHRDIRGGRNFEYYSEDPLLSGKMAASVTRGVQSENVAVTLKHFAINNTEHNRLQSNSRISARAAREIYLKNFEIIFKEGQPWSVMSCYNSVNGVKVCEDYNYMTVIPRQEWGFEGFFMTDWGNNSNHVKEEIAGNEVKMPSGSPSSIVSAVQSGTLSRERLEENVGRMLVNLMKTNVFLKSIQGSGIVHEVSASEPTKIKAVDYDRASAAIGYEACEDTDGGNNPTNTRAGEYLEYVIDAEKAGTYQLTARTAVSTGGAAFDVYVDGELIGNSGALAATGGWQTWTDTDVCPVTLEAGTHRIRISFTVTGMNVNYFTLEPVEIAHGAEFTAPAEAYENEQFDVTVKTDANTDFIYFTNESGKKIGASIKSLEYDAEGNAVFTAGMSIGSAGAQREISCYTSMGEKLGSFKIDILKFVPETGIYSVNAPDSAAAGENFEITAVTSADLVKAKLRNENSNVVAMRQISVQIDGEGYRTAVYETSVGTSGSRTLTFTAALDKSNDFAYSMQFPIEII